ncbi:MAG: hypothetical protein ACK5LP_05040 [Campylobacteraceae bacterium]
MKKITDLDLKGEVQMVVGALDAFGEMLFYTHEAGICVPDTEYIIYIISDKLKGLL